jgi:hypothetical protein
MAPGNRTAIRETATVLNGRPPRLAPKAIAAAARSDLAVLAAQNPAS